MIAEADAHLEAEAALASSSSSSEGEDEDAGARAFLLFLADSRSRAALTTRSLCRLRAAEQRALRPCLRRLLGEPGLPRRPRRRRLFAGQPRLAACAFAGEHARRQPAAAAAAAHAGGLSGAKGA